MTLRTLSSGSSRSRQTATFRASLLICTLLFGATCADSSGGLAAPPQGEPTGPNQSGSDTTFGPAAFPASVVITGEDWQGVTKQEVLSWNFFFHEGGSPDPGPFIDLESDPVFGTVLKMHQTEANFTVKARRSFAHERARGRAFVAREWLYSAIHRFDTDWGFPTAVNDQWKYMFAYAADGSGTARVEMAFVDEGDVCYMSHSGELPHWVYRGTLKAEEPRDYDIASGDYYQTVMFVKRVASGDVRMGWARRKLTQDGGRTLAPGPWRGIVDGYGVGTWNDADGFNAIGLGENINARPSESQFVYYGPWVVLDLSDPAAPGDPWGLFTYFGI